MEISTHNEKSRLVAKNDTDSPPSVLNSILGYFNMEESIRQKYILYASIALLVIATASERVCFKMAVDRMVPISRTILIQFIFFVSAFVYGVFTIIRRGFTPLASQIKEFPHRQLMTIAVMDTFQFVGLVVSAAGVSPTMTVVLLHASTPCIMFFSRSAFPERKYSQVQMVGSVIISASIFICLSRPLIYHILGRIGLGPVLSCVAYVLCAAFQGFITMYKEKAIIEWARPLDIYHISAWLFYYQTIVSVVLGPFIFLLQGYPFHSLLSSYSDGRLCLSGVVPDSLHLDDNAGAILCTHTSWLVVGYVLATVMVLECVHYVLQVSSMVLGRALAASVLGAFLALGLYDHSYDAGYSLFGTNIGIADIVAIVVLIAGMEVYGRDAEPDVEIITNYQP